MRIYFNPMIFSILHLHLRLPHNPLWWKAYLMRSLPHNNLNYSWTETPNFERLSNHLPWAWYIINELCTGEYAKLRPHFQHGLGNVVLRVSYFEFHRAQNCGLHIPFLVKPMQCDCQVLIICNGRPHVACEQNVCHCTSLWHCTPYGFHHLICLILHWPHHISLTDLWVAWVHCPHESRETWLLPKMQGQILQYT